MKHPPARGHEMSATVLAAFVVALLVLPAVVAEQADQAEVQLKAAITKETVDGDLKAAIELYRKIAQSSNRPVAARALIRMGQCYEKLGDAQAREARKAYERVVREFADQKDAAEQARALLAARDRSLRPAGGVSEQQVWVRSDPPRERAGVRFVFAPSADGRYIPFMDAAATRMSLRDLAAGEDRVVVEREGGYFVSGPVISPDSRQIAYTRFRRPPMTGTDFELHVAGIDGSRTKVLVTQKDRWIWPLGWSPDSRHILAGVQGNPVGLSLVTVTDGSVRVLTTEGEYSNGCFSPDGRYIVTYRAPLPETPSLRPPGGLKLLPVDGGREVALFESPAANWWPFWSPDGRHIVFLSDRSGTTALWAIGMTNGRPEGEPELVRRNIGSMQPLGFTRDGSFYYKATTDSQGNIFTADLDPATARALSKAERINQRFVGNAGLPVEWSPDGQFLAYTGLSREYAGRVTNTTVSLVLRSERTGEEREVPLVPPLQRGLSAAELQWFPDGRSLLAQVVGGENNSRSFFSRIDAQTGQVTPLLDLGATNDSVYYPALSHDGSTLFYVQTGAKQRANRLMRRDLVSGEARELYRADWVENLVVSADGRELLFEGSYQDQNTMSLLIMPAKGGVPRELYRSKNYIGDHIWTRDGQRVWMAPLSKAGAELWSIPAGGGEPQPSGLAGRGMYSLSLTPDGRRMAFYSGEGTRDEVWVIKNLLSGSRATPK